MSGKIIMEAKPSHFFVRAVKPGHNPGLTIELLTHLFLIMCQLGENFGIDAQLSKEDPGPM